MNMKRAVRLFLLFCMVFGAWTPPVRAANLLENPGFELGDTAGWTCWGGNLTVVYGPPHSGAYCALMSDRTEKWQGPVQSIHNVVNIGPTYRFSAWVKLQAAASDQAGITVAQWDAGGAKYTGIGWTTVYRDRWTYLSGTFVLKVNGLLTRLDMYVEGPKPGVSFYVDDVCVEELGSWRDVVRTRTEQNRKRQASILVLSSAGKPVPGAGVHLRQIGHHFAFGSAINPNVLSPDRVNRYANFFRDHFEWAVLENESKWYRNEPVQGLVNYQDADRIYNWCHANGITMRGHCLYWSVDQFVQDWLKALNTTQLRAAVEGRMDSAVPHFKGKFVHWDINNEMIPGHFYKDRLGESIHTWMYQRAHALDPNCRLFVNEYGVIDGGYNLDACMQLVRQLRANGAPVNGIGVQCHFDSGWDRWGVLDRFDTLATLGLPIWCSEFDMADPDVRVRAQEIEDFYRIAFSNASVGGIMMWGFWQNSQWRQNCYIVNADWSLNEAGRRYEALRKEWTTEATGVTDADGTFAFRGFQGTYELTVVPSAGAPATNIITLSPGKTSATFTVTLK